MSTIWASLVCVLVAHLIDQPSLPYGARDHIGIRLKALSIRGEGGWEGCTGSDASDGV